MGYLSAGSLTELTGLASLRALFLAHGWTASTAVCVMLFSLMHWPCGTTFLTIRKETGSLKWSLLSVAVPTLCGLACCAAFAYLSKLAGLL